MTYILPLRMYLKRSLALSTIGLAGFCALEWQRQYMLSRGDMFAAEYEMIKGDTTYWHALHEQVQLGFDEKTLHGQEESNGILKLREKLASKAQGIVLETNIGTNRNYPYYNHHRIRQFIGVDWVMAAV